MHWPLRSPFSSFRIDRASDAPERNLITVDAPEGQHLLSPLFDDYREILARNPLPAEGTSQRVGASLRCHSQKSAQAIHIACALFTS